MILIDANVLLYAYNPSFDQHARARRWLEETLSRPEPVRLTSATILAFLRIATNPHAFEHPLSIDEAVAIVAEWLRRPMVDMLEPGERYWEILSELLATTQVRAALVMDAHLAAVAIEHGAALCTTDRDFRRFAALRTINPLA